jgi:hypothetical protein
VTVPAPGGQPAVEAAVPSPDLPDMTLLVQALENAPTLSAILTGPELTLVLQNRRSRDVLGARELGRPLVEAFPESAPSADGMRQVMFSGRTVEEERLTLVRDA